MTFKRGFLFALIPVIVLAAIFNKLVYYGFVQARGQLEIVFNSIPVKEVLAIDSIPENIKLKLQLVQEVRDFAVEVLGLEGAKNYSTIYMQNSDQLMWVVTACHPFKMEAYEWKFPVLGSVSYKGFFIEEMANDEAARLKAMGYDTGIRNAGGWSTLGILKDPILSGMLERDSASLIDLIIHELSHATIFVKNDIAFNENLATFIGQQGTRFFLSEKMSIDTLMLYEYILENKDRETFSEYVVKNAYSLDSLYGTFTDNMTLDQKNAAKIKGIQEFIAGIDTINFYNKRYYQFFDDFFPDNTFFMSYLRYRGGLNSFQNELLNQFNGNLVDYIFYLKSKYKR